MMVMWLGPFGESFVPPVYMKFASIGALGSEEMFEGVVHFPCRNALICT